MVKYETKFKLEVVESFLAGEGGAKLLARRWSVSEEKIRSWVSRYRVHGVAGLQPKRGSYTAQFKVQVLSHQDRDQLSSRPGGCDLRCSQSESGCRLAARLR
jgi:transposase